MMDNPICCAPRVDRFLAVTKTKPLESTRLVKTVKQSQVQSGTGVADGWMP